MSSTDIRFNRMPINVSNVAGTPVVSATPSNSDALIYNATSGYYEMEPIFITEGGGTIVGNVDFVGGTIQIGANGTPLREFRYGTVNRGTPNIISEQSLTDSVTFTPAFSSPPHVQILAWSSSLTDFALTALITSTPTVNGFDWAITNENTVTTNGNLAVHWMAYI